jgi:hypothetical protein
MLVLYTRIEATICQGVLVQVGQGIKDGWEIRDVIKVHLGSLLQILVLKMKFSFVSIVAVTLVAAQAVDAAVIQVSA